MNIFDEEKRKIWTETVEKPDFSRSSKKVWSLLRKLGAAHLVQKEDNISANTIFSMFLKKIKHQA